MANALSQLAGLYTKENKIIDASDVHQNVFMDKICRMFAVLVTLDCVINDQGALKDHWVAYKRMVNAAEMDPEKYNTTKEKVALLRKLLLPIEKNILAGNIYGAIVSQNFDKNGINLADNARLGDEFGHYIKLKLSELETSVTTNPKVIPNSEERLEFVGFCGIYVLHNILYFNNDKKLLSRILELCKKLPAIPLYGNTMWFPEKFLLEHLPALAQNIDKKIWSSFSPNRQNFLHIKSSSAPQDVKQFHLQLNGWMMKMEGALSRQVKSLTLDHLQRVASLLLQGWEIADAIRANISTILNLHMKLFKVINSCRVNVSYLLFSVFKQILPPDNK